ncbi:MAG: IclR family transcriptional regulator [Sphaerochaetaceae bacterium]|nr:IclR family transcriptional regulator [Sphaerochaetaceae bacterium]
MAKESDKYSIKTIEKGFLILDYISEQNHPVSLQEISDATQLNNNMAFRLLVSLVNSGYVKKDNYANLYSISLKSLKLSRNALHSVEIRKISMPYMEMLWSQYPKANINLAVYYQGEVLVIGRIDSQNLPRTYFTPGRVLPFHCSGLGKILTCTLPEKEIDELISKGLKQYTVNTITDEKKLKENLLQVRAEMVGRDRNEFIAGDNCSAVPILGKDGNIIAGLSLSALDNYMSEQEVENTIPKLKETAQRISSTLGYNSGFSF